MIPFKFFKKQATTAGEGLDSPVFQAVHKNKVDQLKKILQTDPQALFEQTSDNFHHTLLQIAVISGHTQICEFILAQPSVTPEFVNLKDSKGRTCLHLAASGFSHEVLALLLQNEAVNVKAVTPEEDNVFHLLGKYFPVVKEETIRAILQKGVNINEKDAQGNTPLHRCAEEGYLNMAKLFIENGAVTNIQNKNGETSLHFASRQGHLAMVELLMSAGASPFIEGEFGTPANVSANNTKLKKLLENPIVPKLKEEYGKANPKNSNLHAFSAPNSPPEKEAMDGFSEIVKHRIILKTCFQDIPDSDTSSRDQYRKNLIQSVQEEVVSELKHLFPEDWLRQKTKAVMLQPLFSWNIKNIDSNKIEVFKWLTEVVEDENLLQTYLAFLQQKYPKDIHISQHHVRHRSKVARNEKQAISERTERHSDSTASEKSEKRSKSREKRDKKDSESVDESSRRSKRDSIDSGSTKKRVGSVKDKVDPSVRTSSRGSQDMAGGAIKVHIKSKSRPTSVTYSNTESLRKSIAENSLDSDSLPSKTSSRALKSVNFQKAKSYSSAVKLSLADRKIQEFEWEISLDDVLIKEKIGKGGFGQVHKGEWKGQAVAIKKLRKESNSDSKLIRGFLKEISILSDTKHPNILRFVGASLGSAICLITEYCPHGDLTTYLQMNQVDWKTKLRFTKEVANGMFYLHTLTSPIVHRDLKGSNVLVAEDLTLKLSDFGLGKHAISIDDTAEVGTINWCAPEVLFDDDQYSFEADIYSFGMVCFEIASNGEMPFAQLNAIQTLRAIEQGEKPKLPTNLPSEFIQIVQSCWKEKSQRPNFSVVVSVLEKIV